MTRRDFVSMVANLTQDGETDDDGQEFAMENDDAIATLNRLIDMAREINRRGDVNDG